MDITDLLAGGGPHARALDVFYIPEARIDEFFTKFENMIDSAAEDGASPEIAKYKFWRWLEAAFPVLQGQQTRLNFADAVRPAIDVLGATRKPKVGRRFAQIIEVQPEHEYEILELMEKVDVSASPRARYELWKFVAHHYKEVDTTNPGWKTLISPATGVLLVRTYEEEDEDETEMGIE